MRTRLSLLAACLALVSLPLLAHAVRPVKPSGPAPEMPDAGPPAPLPVAPEAPAAPPPSKPVEAQKPAAPQQPAKPVETQKPAESKPAEPAKKPVGAPAEAQKPAEAAKPPPEKKIENPAEVTYRQKAGEHAFALRVRPGAPKPGEPLELEVDVAILHDPPDPVQGDREPLRDADLVVSLEKGKAAPAHLLHALGDPGRYGAHLMTYEPGLYTVRIGRRSGKPGVDATFPLGIGAATPVRPDDVQATLTPQSRGPVRAQDPKAAPEAPAAPSGTTLSQTMRALGDRFLQLDAQLDGKGDATATAKAMVELSKGIAGQVPLTNKDRPREFDGEAASLTKALTELAAGPSKQKLSDVEQNHCLRCHAQFRWGVAADVSSWPSFAQAQEAK